MLRRLLAVAVLWPVGANDFLLHGRWWIWLGEVLRIDQRDWHSDLWPTSEEAQICEKIAGCESLYSSLPLVYWFPLLWCRIMALLSASLTGLRNARCLHLRSGRLVSTDLGATEKWKSLPRLLKRSLVDARQRGQWNHRIFGICTLGTSIWSKSRSRHETCLEKLDHWNWYVGHSDHECKEKCMALPSPFTRSEVDHFQQTWFHLLVGCER